MRTLTARLSDMNEDGLRLVLLARNDDMATIQGSVASLNKFSYVPLDSLLTATERTRMFSRDGTRRRSPLTDAETDRLAARVRVYGDEDTGSYRFTPVRWMFEFSRSCFRCIQAAFAEPSAVCGTSEHPLLVCGPNLTDAGIINGLGEVFRWFCEAGHFTPRSTDTPKPSTNSITQTTKTSVKLF